MSLRKAINDMCRTCIYDEYAPGRWIEQVSACTVTKCALYPVRPTTNGAKMATFKEVAHEDAL